MNLSFREITLYRFRFVIGYVVFGILLAVLLMTEIRSVPPGLSTQEMESVTRSVTLNVLSSPPEAVINAPYLLLQKASVWLFGLSPLSIKLPSMILAALLAVSMVGVLRRFFRLGATNITILLMVSSLPFLVMARTGAPLIMLSFLSALLLITSSFVLKYPKHNIAWKLLAVVAAIALLYTPLGIYPLLAFVLAALFHPHLRYHVTHTKPLEWAAIVAVVLVSLSLLVIAVINKPSILLTLSGIPQQLPSWADIGGNLMQLSGLLFGVADPQFGLIAAPVFGLPLLILMVFGILQLIKDRHSARAYVLLGWLGVFLIILSLNTDHVFNLFIPATLLLAVGIEALLREWYSLFPKNPYARIAALVPLAIFVFGIASTEISRYFDGYRYATDMSSTTYRRTLVPLKQVLSEEPLSTADHVILVVAPDDIAFYDLLRREYDQLSVMTEPGPLQGNQYNIVLGEVETDIQSGVHGELYRIQTSAGAVDNLLFSVYRTAAR